MSNGKDAIDWSIFKKGAPGRSARVKAAKEGLKYIFPLLILSFVPLYVFLKWQRVIGVSWVITLTIIVWVLIKHLQKKIEERSDPWLVGAQGEGLVAKALHELESDDFRFIHDLPNGRGNIDHVAIGRTGLFVIETKRWSGRMHYTDGKLCRNGRPLQKDPLKQVKGQAIFMAKKIERVLGRRLWVEPILCFVGTSIESNASTIENVHLTSLQSLRYQITKRKVVLSKREVAQIHAAVEQLR